MSAPEPRAELARAIRRLERDGDEHGVVEPLRAIGDAMDALVQAAAGALDETDGTAAHAPLLAALERFGVCYA